MAVNPDKIWREVETSSGQDKQLIDDLCIALVENIEMSKLFIIIKYVEQLAKEEKSISILDYGCGGGQLLTYLRILGYKNLIGVDVRNQKTMNQLNILHDNMGFGSDTFLLMMASNYLLMIHLLI